MQKKSKPLRNKIASEKILVHERHLQNIYWNFEDCIFQRSTRQLLLFPCSFFALYTFYKNQTKYFVITNRFICKKTWNANKMLRYFQDLFFRNKQQVNIIRWFLLNQWWPFDEYYYWWTFFQFPFLFQSQFSFPFPPFPVIPNQW